VNDGAVFPVLLSIRVALVALAVALPIGLSLALLQATTRYRGKALVDALILLPLVLPPSVVGFVLVFVFGTRGPLGSLLARALDVHIVFTEGAAVLASAVVALPLIVKTAQPALESVPEPLVSVARTLGLRPREVALRVLVPCAWRGIVAAAALGFARALGEFGATLMFAGDIPGRTNTMAIEIYAAAQQGNDARAAMYVGVLVALSLVVVLVAGAMGSRPGFR
jgi:molybdate transport system permease protein